MHPLLINGVWVDPATDAALEILNPATLTPLARVADCDAVDVRRAVTAAQAALPAWRAATPAVRAEGLLRLATRVRAQIPALALLHSQESGQALWEARDLLGATAACFEAAACEAPPAPVPAAGAGVVAVAVPGEGSLLSLARLTARRLAAGDTLVLRVPAACPLAALALCAQGSDLPNGVLNALTGSEATTRELLAHTAVTALYGASTEPLAGTLATVAAERRAVWQGVELGRGAVGPFIVCHDAPLARAARAIAWACLYDAGQACGVRRHVYVDRAVAGAFLAELHGCVGLLDVGDPAKLATDIGPLQSLAAVDRVEAQVMTLLRERAMPVLGGRRFKPSGLPGYFFHPTILCEVRIDSAAARQPLLGPVILVTGVADLDEALGALAAMHTPAVTLMTGAADSARVAIERAGIRRYRINGIDPIVGPDAAAVLDVPAHGFPYADRVGA